jgi:hypothetical protein
MAGLRSASLLPHATLAPLSAAANSLTVISMPALGLDTDLRTVARAGGRVAATFAVSLLVLGFISFGLIRLLGVARFVRMVANSTKQSRTRLRSLNEPLFRRCAMSLLGAGSTVRVGAGRPELQPSGILARGGNVSDTDMARRSQPEPNPTDTATIVARLRQHALLGHLSTDGLGSLVQ